MFLQTTAAEFGALKSAFTVPLLVLLSTLFWLDAPLAQSATTDATTSTSVTNYLDAIDRVEAAHSAYATELSDLYMGLGRALINEANYPEAQRALHRGMQVERVNYGLDSISQTPYLFLLADLDAATGDYKASQDALESLYQISAKHYGAKDQRMLTTLDQMLDWQLRHYRKKPPRKGFSHIVAAERVSVRMAKILNASVALSDPQAPPYYAKLAAIQYFIADHIDRHGVAPKANFEISTGPDVLSQTRSSTSFNYYRRGKSALLYRVDALMQQNQDDPLVQAVAIAELADWYLVFGQTHAATEAYRLAFETLTDDGVAEEVRANFFAEPKKIDFVLDASIDTLDTGPSALQVGIWITATGRPKDIQVIDPPETLTGKYLDALRSSLRKTRYRPRMIDGTPEAVAYRVSYPRPASPPAQQEPS
jgi:tetratricopeptide (TPR) repeat protein